MKPYSADLRQRIIAALEEGAANRAVAERFDVSLSSVKRYKRLWKTKETVAPKPIPGRPPHIKESQQQQFRDLVASKTNWTLATLGDAWKEQTGVKPTLSVLSDTCKRLNITRKKRHVLPENVTHSSEKSSKLRWPKYTHSASFSWMNPASTWLCTAPMAGRRADSESRKPSLSSVG